MSIQQPQQRAGQKILIVDDEDLFLQLIKDILDEEGINATATSSPANALNIINTTDVDILITDIKMPEISGIELAIKAKSKQPDTAVIFITGYSDLINGYSGDLDFEDYFLLKKPFPMDDMVKLLRELGA
ncbi:MAG: response regulator [Candidatus Auribacterota bacterium]|jgi:YesN/AraC family two-component response regulator|nr:response regulator [Candidatus Auribacterota bacterium]